MPTYQYACTSCGNQLEAVQSFSDAPLTECPACEGRLRKLFSSVGIVFKGSGFYRTDSRAATNGKTKEPASAAAGGSGDSGAKAKDSSGGTSSSSDTGSAGGTGSTSSGSSTGSSSASSGSSGGTTKSAPAAA